MKMSVLHVGGHADGRYIDCKLIRGDDGYHLDPGYTLREIEPIDTDSFRVRAMNRPWMIEAKVKETYYVRDFLICGDDETFVYIDRKLRFNNPGSLIKALVEGYRRPNES